MKPIKPNKPLCSLSLDLDNQWSYMKTHGDSGWENFPSYFDVLMPYTIELLDRYDLKITFFIVGQDAALEKNRIFLRLITNSGHEVGNHSFHHEPWLKLYSKQDIQEEIQRTEDHINKATGQMPTGFRGPGFSYSQDLLEVLNENGYLYDASTFPTYLGPLARLYYFWTSDLSEKEKEKRKELFGRLAEGRRPIKPYCWNLHAGKKILELPVTTIPVIKSPFHLSYLLYLSRFSSLLMSWYLNLAIGFCRISNTEPSFLLHPLDLLGGDQVPELAFFPGMDLNAETKHRIFKKVILTLSKHFNLVNMSTYAKATIQRGGLPLVTP